ncbi:hypothetical protein CC86DRAFT_208688 [Ophiobolus disseminans]|uniref:BTB domain-containing protein n=1 Tax=Ophiobolus disseminans TaxID=1469910 RepID=A0A6A7A1P8_9PLEO|nr:hypothetical protein CC86DRAFT_208688 [Ophiobolus disseminans]
MAAETDKSSIEFKSDSGRILKTDAFNLVDMITVELGEDRVRVRHPVIESVIRKSSKFFDNAMKPEWATARPDPRVIDLSDEGLDIFKIYLHWLYFRTLLTVVTDGDGPKNPEYLVLFRCYIISDKFVDIEFNKVVLNSIVDALEYQPYYSPCYPGQGPIRIIYDGTTEGAPARRLLVDLWVKYVGESWVKHIHAGLPHDFVVEFSRALLLKKCDQLENTRSWKECITEYYQEQEKMEQGQLRDRRRVDRDAFIAPGKYFHR